MQEQTNSTQQIAVRVSLWSIAANGVLTALKLLAGVFGRSAAMVSDAVHSASDVLSTVAVIIGVKMAGQEADEDHPYGHERMECITALILAGLLAATGIGIGYSGFAKIFDGTAQTASAPALFALVMALVSIAVKEGMYWVTRRAAKKTGSGALMADAWHHRSDALSSVGSFIGILGARMGLPILDPAASIVISLFIVKAAFDIACDATGKITDRACDRDMAEAIEETVCKEAGVVAIDSMKTRVFGERIYVDVEIQADGLLPLYSAHEIAQRAHDAVELKFPQVKHCMVHVNPAKAAEKSE